MIKKDIDYNHIQAPKQSQREVAPSTKDSVDEIFNAADQRMLNHHVGYRLPGQRKKRKRGIVSKLATSVLIVFVLLIFAFASVGVYVVEEMYPAMVNEIVSQLSTSRERLVSMNDDDLTTEEYYQKQILLLFTDDDVVKAMNDSITLETVLKIISGDEELVFEIIPPDKMEEYNRIVAEYEQAMLAEEQSSLNSTIEPTDVTETTVTETQ